MLKRIAVVAATLVAGIVFAQESFTFNAPADWGSTFAKDAKNVDGTLVVPKTCMMTSARRVTIDPAKTYELTFQVKSGTQDQVKILAGFACYAKNGRFISCVNAQPIAGTDTVLVEEAKAGATTIKVKDASKWGKQGYYAIALNTKEDYSDLPNFDIHSSTMKNAVQEGESWTVTLARPLKKDLPAGTALRQMANGGYLYTAGIKKAGADFITMQGTITGIAKSGYATKIFPPGTAQVGVLILNNWDKANAPVIYKDITLTVK